MIGAVEDYPTGISIESIDVIKELADQQQVLPGAPDSKLFKNFVETLTPWLEDTLDQCTDPDTDTELACGWLLDNDYLIRRAIRQIKHDLPQEFYLRLPVAQRLDEQRLPRILTIAQHVVAENDLQLGLSSLIELIEAYQSAQDLVEAELWAFPVMARLSCLDILRQECSAIFSINVTGLTDVSVSENSLPRISGSSPKISMNNAQCTDRVAGVISALVALNEIDWSEFVEATSKVEAVLGNDPAMAYSRMNRQTRSHYRSVVERLADRSLNSEVQVALRAVEAAKQQDSECRQTHVGYWLIGEGYAELETLLDCSRTLMQRIRSRFSMHAMPIYGVANLLLMLLAVSVPVTYAVAQGGSYLAVFITLLLSLIPASVLSIALVNFVAMRLVAATSLPALDSDHGIPADAKTVITIPVIVGSVEEARYSIERLELRYLSNPESGLVFVLLSDPVDSQVQRLDTDQLIEEELISGISSLNERYQDVAGDRFILLHRHRTYSRTQGCWMAYERKRGKLEQFGELLSKGSVEPFTISAGNIKRLADVRYMITLDADTLLPPGAALRLICTLAHPLNKAEVDRHTGRVFAGYTVLQPRVETLTTRNSTSLFAKVFAGDCAIDIYSRAVSDVYQDLFGVGSYVGKGIHDVQAFQDSLSHRVPENSILSHDLFEGIHGRVGLATDIILYEDFPESWAEYAARQHRWIRGDWQLLPWLGRSVPVAPGIRERSVFNFLDRWKLLDNLRRSIIPFALCLYFVAGWLWLPGSPIVWTLFAVGSFAPYLLDEAFSGLATLSRRRKPQGFSYRIRYQVIRALIAIVFLVADACNALDAATRTVWRVYFTGKNLLQWTSSAHASLSKNETSRAIWRLMWPSPIIAIVISGILLTIDPYTLLPAFPILLCWFFAPWIAIVLGRKKQYNHGSISNSDRYYLRKAARRIWHYFDEFCQPNDHWLPPDNYQSVPGPILAHRTSPTNIGLYLSSTLAARDLGFIGLRECMIRIRNVLDTLDRLERHRGHWLNWYDTSTLASLEPRYVSTVDSGNLAICLLAIKHGCSETGELTLLGDINRAGLLDTFELLKDSIRDIDSKIDASVLQELAKVSAQIENSQGVDGYQKLQDVAAVLWPRAERVLVDSLVTNDIDDATVISEIHIWLGRFGHQLHGILRDLDDYAPWLRVLQASPLAGDVWLDDARVALVPELPLSEQLISVERLKNDVKSKLVQSNLDSDVEIWMYQFRKALDSGSKAQHDLLAEANVLSDRAELCAYSMDFSWLYDQGSRLFRIGYNLSNGQLDANHYNLLASEARMASFFAIAKHDVPLEHWFQLGRPVVRHHAQPVAQSWNGSMFEYLMPSLFLHSRRETFLGESESIAVLSQQADARKRRTPWGVSESGFAETDAQGHYQYRAFGTPELGIRRGLSDDCVVAPYASMLALSVSPDAAVANLREIQSMGAVGRYGFMEALDFTASRLQVGESFKLVESWMAHHQGMSLTAIVNALQSNCMQRRLLKEKSVQTVELLLQERVPWSAPSEKPRPLDPDKARSVGGLAPIPSSWIPNSGSELLPQIQLLGNGQMAARISQSGGGAIFLNDIALTRWRDDALRSAEGYRIHVYDNYSGAQFWLGARQGAGSEQTVQTIFANDHVEIIHRFINFTIRLEITVSARENVDIRRIRIASERSTPTQITVTSFAEVALASVADDSRHPAFSKLFVHSKREPQINGISFMRRVRHPDDKRSALVHRVVGDAGIELTSIETDREKWLGRLGSNEHPDALSHTLSGTTGWTLDPVMAIQVTLTIPSNDARQCAFITSAADTREQALKQSLRVSLSGMKHLLVDSAQVAAQETQRIGIRSDQLPLLQTLASLLIYPHHLLRRVGFESAWRSSAAQSDLWSFGISGDLPMLILRMSDHSQTENLDTLLRAQALWRTRKFTFDLMIMRIGPESYEEPLRQRIQDSLRDTGGFGWLGRHGGIHLLSEASMDASQRCRLESVASMVLTTEESLERQLEVVLRKPFEANIFQPIGAPSRQEIASLENPIGLLYDNSFGGFCKTSGDYLIHLEPGSYTPSPWCNILANVQFGSIVSENSLGFSWSINSGEHRLTSWSNDPVIDTPGEMLFLRDEATAEHWTVTPSRPYHSTAIQIRHSAGYTSWSRNSHGLEQELLTFVDIDDPVKCIRLRLKNQSGQDRRLTITYYAEWLLGAVAEKARHHVRCRYDPNTQSILACNGWNSEFAQRLSFISANKPPHSVTGDRRMFLGEGGDVLSPAALLQSDLGGQFPAGGDTCGAYQVHVDLADGCEEEIVFLLGDVESTDAVSELLSRWRDPSFSRMALHRVLEHWENQTSAITVKTPDAGFDLMVNRWLIYQTLSSRIYARAGFYQAGGAYGFRDQLQDVVALLAIAPQRVRQQILLAAQHQFEEGDVLHWWHPPEGRGVRTHITDDRLWLPWVTGRYIEATGDFSILDEEVYFLRADELKEGERDRYSGYNTGDKESIYEHCCRAVDFSLELGSHGLPLMGTGDWNDGMDCVGDEGRGESVWLAWFHISVIDKFMPFVQRRNDAERALRYRRHAVNLKQSIETHAWDGEWYIRAFDDNGQPWGSHSNEECRIDAIAQAWGALSGFGHEQRTLQALASAKSHLVDQEQQIVRLLTPPFDQSTRNPGYIKAYPPGIRENGGQYSHAAAWLGLAFAEVDDADTAYEIFNMISPVSKANDRDSAVKYSREPYVVSADIGGESPQAGRGGWSWYTGAAGWSYQLAVHGLLGIHYGPSMVRIEPRIPSAWNKVDIRLRQDKGELHVVIERQGESGSRVVLMTLNDVAVDSNEFIFPPAGQVSEVRLVLEE